VCVCVFVSLCLCVCVGVGGCVGVWVCGCVRGKFTSVSWACYVRYSAQTESSLPPCSFFSRVVAWGPFSPDICGCSLWPRP
jgi:hypothetical protein